MTKRASDSMVAVLIRIGLLIALAILLMAENAQTQPLPSSPCDPSHRAGFDLTGAHSPSCTIEPMQ
jgi:hypothetical protein